MSSSTQRACRVLKALRGHTLNGVSNIDLSKQLNESPTNITRALQDLMAEDLVVKLDNGNFAHGRQTEQIALAHLQALQQAQARVQEHLQRAAIYLT